MYHHWYQNACMPTAALCLTGLLWRMFLVQLLLLLLLLSLAGSHNQ
jgi:hypothetical protein